MGNLTLSAEVVRRAMLDQAIVALDKQIAAQLEAICDHPHFVELRTHWFGLEALTKCAGSARNVEIDLLACSREALDEDFDTYLDLSDSALFHHLYKNEYDQAGGTPYTSVLMQYSFGKSPADVSLLRQISKVAASCHCPVIVNASPSLFGMSTFQGLEDINDFQMLFDGGEFQRWRQFSQAEDTRYLGMVLPRVLITRQCHRSIPKYCRQGSLGERPHAWAPASIGFGMTLVRSYVRYGWCVYIRGNRTGGLLEDIEPLDCGLPGLAVDEPPLEILFSDRQEHELAALGLIPFCYNRKRARPCIYSAPTMQNVSRLRSESGQFDRLAASLPYLYLVSRIAHYQKAIQRENIGLVRESAQLERDLNKWLSGLITTMGDPNMEMRSERPLAGGMLEVTEDPQTPGFFQVRLVVQPHLQLEGINAKLELKTKMPRKKE